MIYLSISFIASHEAGRETFLAGGLAASMTTMKWRRDLPAEMTDTLDQLTD